MVGGQCFHNKKNQDSPARDQQVTRSRQAATPSYSTSYKSTQPRRQSSKQRLVLAVHQQASKAGLGRVRESSVARGSDSWLLSVGACVVRGIYIQGGVWLCGEKGARH